MMTISKDEQAIHLVELEIKRNRTLSDLDAIQEARRSVHRTLEAKLDKPDEIFEQYTRALERDDLDEDRQKQLYQEWRRFLDSVDHEAQELGEEYHRLQIQERILAHMLAEINKQIDDTKEALK
jgi:hypothetical protein